VHLLEGEPSLREIDLVPRLEPATSTDEFAELVERRRRLTDRSDHHH